MGAIKTHVYVGKLLLSMLALLAKGMGAYVKTWCPSFLRTSVRR